ncbi:MAG TPA: hypothetical protein VFN49_09210 [Candidatus Aquilonibacter sp.]|nr:hypothetical protein [Candidatus Aquilonibacter sp.]
MILTTAPLVAQASPAPAPASSAAPTPAATPDPAVLANAKAWLGALAAGKMLDATQLTDQMKGALTPQALASGASTLASAGGVKSADFVRNASMQGNTFYVFRVTTGKGNVFSFIYAVDAASGKISGLLLRPAQ